MSIKSLQRTPSDGVLRDEEERPTAPLSFHLYEQAVRQDTLRVATSSFSATSA